MALKYLWDWTGKYLGKYLAKFPSGLCQPAATKVLDWVRLLLMNRRLTKISKYLSFVLRHHPETIGLKLDSERWASVDELVKNANSNGKSITLKQVQDVVELDEQKMFFFSDDGLRIRACP